MSEVAKIEAVAPPAPAPQAAGESAALVSMIERAARDPNVDIDKMERLFLMHERVNQQRAKAAYLAALSAMQPELPVIDKLGEIDRTKKDNSGTQQKAKPTRFAKWEDIVEGVTPVLAKHGFSLTFRIKHDARVDVTAVLGHRDGHSEETGMSLPIDDSGAKNNPQGWGSSISYGKRYTACALLNIVSRGEDDDGKAAGEKPSTVTVEAIDQLIADSKTERTAVLAHYSVETLDDLTAKQRAEVFTRLTAKIAHGRKTNG